MKEYCEICGAYLPLDEYADGLDDGEFFCLCYESYDEDGEMMCGGEIDKDVFDDMIKAGALIEC